MLNTCIVLYTHTHTHTHTHIYIYIYIERERESELKKMQKESVEKIREGKRKPKRSDCLEYINF